LLDSKFELYLQQCKKKYSLQKIYEVILFTRALEKCTEHIPIGRPLEVLVISKLLEQL
jgi:hypothetical protein